MSEPQATPQASQADVPLERDVFLRTLIRHLAGTLEDVVGLDEASGFVSVVGQRIGEEINGAYKKALALIAERAYAVPLYSLPVYYAATADLMFKAYPDEMPRFWEMTWK